MKQLRVFMVLVFLLVATTAWSHCGHCPKNTDNCPKQVENCPKAATTDCPKQANCDQCATCPQAQKENCDKMKKGCPTQGECPKAK